MEQWREELYLGELYHSKGPWKNHKYIKKIGDRYIYPAGNAIKNAYQAAKHFSSAKKYRKSPRASAAGGAKARRDELIGSQYARWAKQDLSKYTAPVKDAAAAVTKTARRASRAVRDEYRRQRNKAAGKAYTRSVISKQNARKRRQAINNAVNDTKKRVGAKLRTMGAIASNRANLASFAAGKAYRQARTAYRNARNKAANRRNTNAALRRQRRRK